MATVPEYGEELLMEEQEDEVEESSHIPLPEWEEAGEVELVEQVETEAEARHPASENHAAHRSGAICGRCGVVLSEHDDARRTVDGQWIHDSCP